MRSGHDRVDLRRIISGANRSKHVREWQCHPTNTAVSNCNHKYVPHAYTYHTHFLPAWPFPRPLAKWLPLPVNPLPLRGSALKLLNFLIFFAVASIPPPLLLYLILRPSLSARSLFLAYAKSLPRHPTLGGPLPLLLYSYPHPGLPLTSASSLHLSSFPLSKFFI
jgi:hypothetical protein